VQGVTAVDVLRAVHRAERRLWPTEKHLAAPVITVRMILSDPLEQLPDLQRPAEGTS
jgi:hypothetical protein